MFNKITGSPGQLRCAARAVPRRGHSKVHHAKHNEREFADGRELVSAQSLRGKSHNVYKVEPLSGASAMLGVFFQHPAKF